MAWFQNNFADIFLWLSHILLECYDTQVYQSIWNFAGSLFMVCWYACDFGIIDNLIFVTPFFLTFELKPFLGLKYY